MCKEMENTTKGLRTHTYTTATCTQYNRQTDLHVGLLSLILGREVASEGKVRGSPLVFL